MRRLPPLPARPWRSGGEADIYLDGVDSGYLLKVYVDASSGAARPKRGAEASQLVRLSQLASGVLPSVWAKLMDGCCWPTELFGASATVVDGIRIPNAGEEFYFNIEMKDDPARGLESRPLELSYLITNYLTKPIIKRSDAPTVAAAERVEIALSALRTLQLFWDAGLVYGDISAKNILWTGGSRPRAYFIDVDGAHIPGESGIHSPDWRPLDHLGRTITGERGVAARMVWRILAHSGVAVMPRLDKLTGILPELPLALAEATVQCHNTGTEEAFAAMVSHLGSARDEKYRRAWFEWAKSTGFARVVLDNRPATLSEEDHRVLEAAERQHALDIRYQRRATRPNNLRLEDGFQADLPQQVSEIRSINSASDLRAAYESNRFKDVARAFACGQCSLHRDSMVHRAIKYALVDIGPPVVRLVNTEGGNRVRVTMEWQWPDEEWVNAAVVRLYSTGGELLSDVIVNRRGPIGRCTAHRPTNGSHSVGLSFVVFAPDKEQVTVPSPHAEAVRIEIKAASQPTMRPPTPSAPFFDQDESAEYGPRFIPQPRPTKPVAPGQPWKPKNRTTDPAPPQKSEVAFGPTLPPIFAPPKPTTQIFVHDLEGPRTLVTAEVQVVAPPLGKEQGPVADTAVAVDPLRGSSLRPSIFRRLVQRLFRRTH